MENIRARVRELYSEFTNTFFFFFWLKQTKRFLFSPRVAINGIIIGCLVVIPRNNDKYLGMWTGA